MLSKHHQALVGHRCGLEKKLVLLKRIHAGELIDSDSAACFPEILLLTNAGCVRHGPASSPGLSFSTDQNPYGLLDLVLGIWGLASVCRAVVIDSLALNCTCLGSNVR